MENQYESPKIIKEAGELLRLPLPNAGEDVEAHIMALDAIRYDVAEACADWGRLLFEKRKQLLWPKDKEMTELDRLTRMNADVAIIERDYALLQKIEVLIKERLDLCFTFLN